MKKKIFTVVLAAALSVSCALTGLTANAETLSGGGFQAEKVSHPDRGAGQTDGVLSFDVMGEESNRNQSYIWSSVEYGDYLYLGTCWNPISGIYYRNLKANLTNLYQKLGDENPAQKAGTVATNIMNLVYNGNFPDGSNSTHGTPCIMRVNKYTYETELVYIEKENSAFVNWNGYRMAAEYKGKLYFACAGYPTSRLLQIDPDTNETKVVLQKTAENSGFANGIRGLTVMNGQLIVSLATDGADPDNMFSSGSSLPAAYQEAIKAMAKKDVRYKDDNPRMQGVRILTTTNPEDVDSWTVIANQASFDDLPACWIRDSINGGGVWDLVPFNGSLYVTMVTGKTDASTGENHKQGFAMYRGDVQSDGSWKWTPIIGDKSKGAKYDFGLGKTESCAGNLFAYGDYLYIGGYNDPMLDIAEIGNNGDFKYLYNDLKNPACLSRMDKNGNIELINDDGFGAASTQYLWRFAEYNGKLVIGTFDISTLASGLTQLTDGSLLQLTDEEYAQKMAYAKELLESLAVTKPETAEQQETAETAAETNVVKETVLPETEMAETEANETETVNAAEEIQTEEIPETEKDASETIQPETEEAEVQSAVSEESIAVQTETAAQPASEENSETAAIETEASVSLQQAAENENAEAEPDVSDEVINAVKASKKGLWAVNDMLTGLEAMSELSSNSVNAASYSAKAGEADVPQLYEQLKETYDKYLKPILDEYAPDIAQQIEDNLFDEKVEQFVYYLGCSQIISTQEKGADILVSSDGVNFKAITTNGFNDQYNHGARTFISTDNGLFVGMANPFWGAQLWRLTDTSEEPDTPETKETETSETEETEETETTETVETETEETETQETETIGPETPDTKGPETPTKPTITKKNNTTNKNLTSTKKNSTAKSKAVKTGDNTNVVLYTAAAGAALAVIIGYVVVSKRKKHQNK